MALFDALQDHKTELIRKSLTGSVFVAPVGASAITALTTATGTAPNQVIDLAPLPDDYEDLGYTTDDGAAFSTESTTSDITSWQSISPTRSDITAETTTLNVVAQETKLLTLGLYTGVDVAGVLATASTGEVQIKKPQRPSGKYYRVLSLAVDENEFGEIYVARFLPRAKISGRGEQSYSKADNAIQYSLTFTGFHDSAYGTAESFVFGGQGWRGLLESMNIEEG